MDNATLVHAIHLLRRLPPLLTVHLAATAVAAVVVAVAVARAMQSLVSYI